MSLLASIAGSAIKSVIHMQYWRGWWEGFTLGCIVGSIATMCGLALAWSHLGG